VRPRAKAGLKPRHRILTGAFTISRWPIGGNLGFGAMPSLRACGARPSAARPAHYGWPRGEDLGTTLKAVFSEGRTLCVRDYRPDAYEGMAS
jgi:hypothetical protein